jgi:hypothetical protein
MASIEPNPNCAILSHCAMRDLGRRGHDGSTVRPEFSGVAENKALNVTSRVGIELALRQAEYGGVTDVRDQHKSKSLGDDSPVGNDRPYDALRADGFWPQREARARL